MKDVSDRPPIINASMIERSTRMRMSKLFSPFRTGTCVARVSNTHTYTTSVSTTSSEINRSNHKKNSQ